LGKLEGSSRRGFGWQRVVAELKLTRVSRRAYPLLRSRVPVDGPPSSLNDGRRSDLLENTAALQVSHFPRSTWICETR
jgi:hypothetical protein